MTQYFGLGSFIPVQGTGIHAHGLGHIGGGHYLVPGAQLTGMHAYGAPLGSQIGNPFIATQSLQNPLSGSILGTWGGQLGYFTPGCGAAGHGLGGSLGELNQGIINHGTTYALIPNTLGNHVGGVQAPLGTTNGLGHLGHGIAGQGTHPGYAPFHQGTGLGLGQSGLQSSVQPTLAAEIAETTHEYVVSFDVPGMDLNNIDVTLGGNTLTINGVRTGLQATSALAYSEIARGNISRAVTLPFDVSAHKAINTSLENGVLKIRISKEEQAGKKASRKINLG